MGSALLAEITALQQALCGQYAEACSGRNGSPVLGLFRLFPGVDLAAWAGLAKEHGLNRWLTLPVDEQAYPHLTLYQEALERLAYQTDHDPLTSLANRRSFERVLDLEIERARRSRVPMSLALIDLDDFKAVNDSHGHPAGDLVLRRLAEVLEQGKRRYDLAARIGGEEFALVLSGVGLVKSAEILGRILESFSGLRFEGAGGESFSVTFSVGIASYRGNVELAVSELVGLADEALYRAKRQGKNRVATAPLPDVDKVANEVTLVHANEKKFLFGK
ncbi:GGDEF domain-containing protein [Desulfovibrio aminophilus]|nr:GGDEF domain-containing protein [Desulfovibrio aminophilus]MCM0754296.1 GGDEF domain-containing protein [Desulfovibrio aminophilus]